MSFFFVFSCKYYFFGMHFSLYVIVWLVIRIYLLFHLSTWVAKLWGKTKIILKITYWLNRNYNMYYICNYIILVVGIVKIDFRFWMKRKMYLLKVLLWWYVFVLFKFDFLYLYLLYKVENLLWWCVVCDLKFSSKTFIANYKIWFIIFSNYFSNVYIHIQIED